MKIKNELNSLRNSFSEYSSKVNWIVFILICLFTLGKLKFQINFIKQT